MSDAGADAGDETDLDASGDASGFDAGTEDDVSLGVWCGSCDIRLVSPLSTARVSALRPTLRWTLPDGADGARVELCRDRALTLACASFDATGSAGRPAADLGVGTWFWRIVPTRGGVRDASHSATWEFRVGYLGAAVDTSYGQFTDINGDGDADLVAGAWQACVESPPPTPDTRLYAYLGAPSGIATRPSVVRTHSPRSDAFGYAVATTDVDGDGFTDVVIGAPDASGGTGLIVVYRGGATGLSDEPLETIAAPPGAIHFGSHMAALGDVDGDGFGDLFVTGAGPVAGVASYSPATWVYRGSPEGLGPSPAQRFDSPTPAALVTIAPAGDTNGDGFADVLFEYGSHADLHLGSSTVVQSAVSATFASPMPSNPVFAAGGADVNNDGYSDIAVAKDLGSETNGIAVYLGGPLGVSSAPYGSLRAPTTTMVGTRYIAQWGAMIAGGDDIDGNGYGDFIALDPLARSAAIVGGGAPGLIRMSTSFRADHVLVGDFDGDRRADVAVGTSHLCSHGLQVYMQSTSGFGISFPLEQEPPPIDFTGFGTSIASGRLPEMTRRWKDV